MAKYNEIMEKISVTPEMRERVLINVHNARNENGASRHKKVSLNKIIPIAAAAAFALVIGITLSLTNYHNNESPVETSETSIEDFSSLSELEASVGFDVPEIANIPFEAESTAYSNVFGLARIDITGTNGEDLTFSKGVDDGTDVSGDHNDYDNTKSLEINGVSVTLKGNGDVINLAVWSVNGYSYAVSENPGITMEEMEGIVSDIIKTD